MSRQPSPKALAKAVCEGSMDFDSVLEILCPDDMDIQTVQLLLCYAAMGRGSQMFDAQDQKTVADMIEEIGLRPFVKFFTGRGQRKIALGELVAYAGKTWRIIGIRRVTPYAMPREDEWEVMLESLAGRPLYLVGLSMVEKLTERSSAAG